MGPHGAANPSLDRPPLGLIVPHGALGHCGPVTAHAFALLAESAQCSGSFPKLVVLLGPDHCGLGLPVSATRQDYATPLGCLPTALVWVDRVCAAAAEKDGVIGLDVCDRGHAQEHALENVLPFLQHQAQMFHCGQGDRSPPWNLNRPEVLPLTVAGQDPDTAKRLGVLLDGVLPREETLVIATSDLCHCGPWYGNDPGPSESRAALCRDRCRRVAEVLEWGDEEQLIAAYTREAWSLCGINALTAALVWARLRGASRVRRLMVADSVSIARAWNDHPDLPRDGSGTLLYPWDLLTGVDPCNPVGFGSFALT